MQARLIESVEIAPEVRHFVFAADGVDRLPFMPGQFVSFKETIEGKEITRAYSIASEPAESNRFELCLNLVHDGQLSPRLFSMRPGETIQMLPPLGMFTHPPSGAGRDFDRDRDRNRPVSDPFCSAHLSETSPSVHSVFRCPARTEPDVSDGI